MVGGGAACRAWGRSSFRCRAGLKRAPGGPTPLRVALPAGSASRVPSGVEGSPPKAKNANARTQLQTKGSHASMHRRPELATRPPHVSAGDNTGSCWLFRHWSLEACLQKNRGFQHCKQFQQATAAAFERRCAAPLCRQTGTEATVVNEDGLWRPTPVEARVGVLVGPMDPAAAPRSMFTVITMLPAPAPASSPGEPSHSSARG